MNKSFHLTNEHIKLLQNSYTSWYDAEFGAACIDPKKPYGNGSVVQDMAKILGIEPTFKQDDEIFFSDEKTKKLISLHNSLETALQIVLCTKSFIPGIYRRNEEYDSISWQLHKKETNSLEEVDIMYRGFVIPVKVKSFFPESHSICNGPPEDSEQYSPPEIGYEIDIEKITKEKLIALVSDIFDEENEYFKSQILGKIG